MVVVVKQISGLGNQLFQYAAGRFFTRRLGADLHVVTQPAEASISHGASPRPVLLSRFAVKAPMSEITRRDRFFLSQNLYARLAKSFLLPLTHVYAIHEIFGKRHEFAPDLTVPCGIKTLYLSGYWQAHAYADAVADELRQEFQIVNSPEGHNAAVHDQIASSVTPISLHVRRGDYMLAVEGNIGLPSSYYQRAIRFFQKEFDNPVFFVFSDDIQFAKQSLPRDIKRVFVEGNNDFSSHEDLRLMSACSHHVVANSSFSWWGAWLNFRRDKIVIAPRHWHLTPESYFPDLLPPSWILFDSLRDS